tara:strand:+ start:34 stop:423 length:390 start_codon:yes stop_codon:yes gene_type:complete
VSQNINKDSGPDQTWFDYLKDQTLALPKCTECEKFHFFPRIVCPHCGCFSLEWQPLSGTGEIYSCTTIHRKPERGGNYNVSLITLDEGPRMMSRVEGIEPESIKIGTKVTTSINNKQPPFVITTPLTQS